MEEIRIMPARKEPTKREQVIDILDRNIKQKNIGFEQLYKTMRSKTGYQFYKEHGYFDDLLETYVKSLGLTFEMYFDASLKEWTPR